MVLKTRQECEAVLMASLFVKFVDNKGRVSEDNYVSKDGTFGVSWNPMIAEIINRELTEAEKRRGVVYIRNADGSPNADPAKLPQALQAYIAIVDKDEGPAPAASPAKMEQPAPGAKTMAQNQPRGAESTALAVAKSQVMAPSGKEFMQPVGNSPTELVITLGDKRYATKNGRWYAMHMSGRRVRSCKPTIIQTPWQKGDDLKFMPGAAVILCTLILDNGTPEGEVYEALGEASPENTSSMIYGEKPIFDKKTGQKIGTQKVNNLLHMAETKAINRALGMATAGGWYIGNNTPQYNVQVDGSCSAEELPDFVDNDFGDQE